MSTLISIITPTYNSSKYISFTYQGIINQSYVNWEWLVTDDCSTDDTYEILLKISQSDPRVKVIRNECNSGAAVSRNSSLSRAAGDYVAFIDADDLWLPDKLLKQLEFMENEGCPVCITSYETMDELGNSLAEKYIDMAVPDTVNYKDLLAKRVTFGCSTVMLNVKSVGAVVMPNIRTGQDYATWLAILKNGHEAKVLKISLTKYRITPGSISRNKVKKALRQWEIYRRIEGLKLFPSMYFFANYAYRAVFRK